MNFIKKEDLERGGIYRIRSRNLIVGVFDGDQGFIGIREKFGDEYLFTEYLSRDLGGTQIPYDTVRPERLLWRLNDEVVLAESLGLKCYACGKPATRIEGLQYPNNHTCEGGCDSNTRDVRWSGNEPLQKILAEWERPIAEEIAKERQR